jgi:hypothetical protein
MAVRMMFIVSSVCQCRIRGRSGPKSNLYDGIAAASFQYCLPNEPMSEDKDQNKAKPAIVPMEAAPRALSPAAKRALEEAEARRKVYLEKEAALPKELGGRGGKEPGRYGDWEVKGLTSDF